MSPKLAFSVDDAEHLQVASSNRPPTLTLRFLIDGLELSAPRAQPVVLPWDDMAASNAVSPSPDSWSVAPWQVGRGGAIGVALRIGGAAALSTEALRRATSTPWRHMTAWYGAWAGTQLLPVLVRGATFDTAQRERSLLEALCAVLHDMPELRPRLDVPHRARHLARDLDNARLGMHSPAPALGGDAVDIEVAMRHLGYVHHYGRPLQTATLPHGREVVDRVVAELAANAYRHGRPVDRALVERVVDRNFTGVAPWPFAGLIDD